MSVTELLEFYQQTGPAMFDKQVIRKRWKSRYKAEPLRRELTNTFGEDTTLFPEHLRCLLLAVTRNASTDSPWPISSNPLAKFNDPSLPFCNLQIPLWKLVRASTAAPIYFPPEVIPWNPDDPEDPEQTFVFVDGGMTPYNNPSFLLYKMATEPAYRLGWRRGEKNLLVISIGTGAAPDQQESSTQSTVKQLAGIPGALMYGSLVDQDINCRVVGRCTHGGVLDSEIGDLIPRRDDGQPIPLNQDLGRAFLYARYNADLTAEGLADLGLEDIRPQDVAKLDSTKFIPELQRVGRAVAERVKAEHLGPFVRLI